MPKPKVGRPKLPKAHRHGRIVPVRFRDEDLKAMTAAAKASGQTLSEWMRSTLLSAILGWDGQIGTLPVADVWVGI